MTFRAIRQRPQRPIGNRDPRAPTAKRQGLSRLQVEAMRERQGNRCALCGRLLAANFAVDHDHQLAELHGHNPERGCPRCTRGLLCHDCNGWLRGWRDDAGFLMRAAKYAASRRVR